MKQVDIIGPVDAALRGPLKQAVEAWARNNGAMRRADGLVLTIEGVAVKGDLARYDLTNRVTFKVLMVAGENVAAKVAKERRERRPVQRMADRRSQGRPGALKRPERTAVVKSVVRPGDAAKEEERSLRAMAAQFGLTLEEAREVRKTGKMPDKKKAEKAKPSTESGAAPPRVGGKFVKKDASASAPDRTAAPKKEAAPKKKAAKKKAAKKKAARK